MLLLLLSVATAAEEPPRSFETLTHRDAVVQLGAWCADDEPCRRAYHIDDLDASVEEHRRHNLFAFLFTHLVPEFDQNERDLLTHAEHTIGTHLPRHNTTALNESLRRTWLLILRLAATENQQVRCDVNKRLVRSPDTLDGFCDCIDGRNCDGAGNWRKRWNIPTITAFAVSTLFVFYLCVKLYESAQVIVLFHQYRLRMRTLEYAGNTIIKQSRE